MDNTEAYFLRRIETLIDKKDTDFINLAIMAYKKGYFAPEMYESFYLEGLPFACSAYNNSWHLIYENIGLDIKTASNLLEDFLLWQYLPHHDSTSFNRTFPIYLDNSLKAGIFFSSKLIEELELRSMVNMSLKDQLGNFKYMNKENYTAWLISQLPQNEENEDSRPKYKV
jgi:hypothetical protein